MGRVEHDPREEALDLDRPRGRASDPASTDAAEPTLIPRVGAGELLAMELDTLPIDALVLELMGAAKHVHEIQIVNGRTPGNIAKALAGEHLGTIIAGD